MLSIGQFSQVCQVSVKTLHHYDKIGLMHPSSVDRWTGYRYYDVGQIPTMLLIQRLKRYGFTLCEISGFLEEPDETSVIKRMNARRESLRADMEESSRILREMEEHLKNIERTGNIMAYQNNYQIQLENSEDMHILSTRQKMSVEDFGKYYGHLFEKAAREKIKTNGKVMAVYHDTEFDPECSDIELALGVEDKAQASRTIKGSLVASTIHKGPYSGLGDAYGAIMRYIKENGYEISDAPYDIYIKTQFDKIPPEEWETKVVFPVKKSA